MMAGAGKVKIRGDEGVRNFVLLLFLDGMWLPIIQP